MKAWSLALAEEKDRCIVRELYHEDAILFCVCGEQVRGLMQIINHLQNTYIDTRLNFVPHFKELTSHSGYEYGIVEMVKACSSKPIHQGSYSIVWTHWDNTSWKIMSHVLGS